MIKFFPHYTQFDAMDCGPSCLRMIARHYGRSYALQTLREKSFITRQGVSMLGISDAAESIGMRSQGVRISFDQIIDDATTCHPSLESKSLCCLLQNQTKEERSF